VRASSSSASTAAFVGAGVVASPRISVVTPCATLPTTRPSPRSSALQLWLWMSMNPGATIRSRASTRVAAGACARGAHRSDARDAVAADPHVAADPGIARAVDDPAVGDHHVVRRGCGPAPRARRAGGERGERGEENGRADVATAGHAREERSAGERDGGGIGGLVMTCG
jgi:hypothetical protein